MAYIGVSSVLRWDSRNGRGQAVSVGAIIRWDPVPTPQVAQSPPPPDVAAGRYTGILRPQHSRVNAPRDGRRIRTAHQREVDLTLATNPESLTHCYAVAPCGPYIHSLGLAQDGGVMCPDCLRNLCRLRARSGAPTVAPRLAAGPKAPDIALLADEAYRPRPPLPDMSVQQVTSMPPSITGAANAAKAAAEAASRGRGVTIKQDPGADQTGRITRERWEEASGKASAFLAGVRAQISSK